MIDDTKVTRQKHMTTKPTPREPTIAMIEAGVRATLLPGADHPDARTIWRTMWDAAPDAGWQPIASAPRDGTPVMVWCADRGDMRVASLMTAIEDGDQSWVYARSIDFIDPNNAVSFHYDNPTHWRALPPLPDAEGGA